ncbi:hypothetical protein MHYP_G00268450 [Metynnis hypsauchen]
MTGGRSGLKAKILERAALVLWNHCMIHCKVLGTCAMEQELTDVSSAAEKIVSFVKTQPTKSHCSAAICANMGAEHQALLMHTKVRGKVLQQFYEHQNEWLSLSCPNDQPKLYKHSEAVLEVLLAHVEGLLSFCDGRVSFTKWLLSEHISPPSKQHFSNHSGLKSLH